VSPVTLWKRKEGGTSAVLGTRRQVKKAFRAYAKRQAEYYLMRFEMFIVGAKVRGNQRRGYINLGLGEAILLPTRARVSPPVRRRCCLVREPAIERLSVTTYIIRGLPSQLEYQDDDTDTDHSG
jgi:hypothetical protein